MQPAEILARRVARAANESTHVNTINVNDRVTIDFVWYPGAANVNDSLIDTLIDDAPDGSKRWLHYTWQREGRPAIRRPMNSSRITVALAPNSKGTLTCFGTSWRIARVANGVLMNPANTLQGVQERLDRLGYHLRSPGAPASGVDNIPGRITELAVLQFQVDYRPAAGAPAAAANPLKVRGEWMTNAGPVYAANLAGYNQAVPVAPNPSLADGLALQASLVAKVGA